MALEIVRALTAVNHWKRSGLLFCFLQILQFIISPCFSQQGNIWYFGEYAGLSFNTNPPSTLTGGQLFTFEGCSSICDYNGQLLFYTDGVKVWNRMHQVMPNGTGLKGHRSSTNSAIIIPRPGSSGVFYIFTAGAAETNNEGYFFSEVDMSLQGGLGDVTTVKNVALYSPSTEKLTAVRHSNGVDVWVITKSFGNAEWKVYKVDCNGVNTTPVTSIAGSGSTSVDATGAWGGVKSSPDGTKIGAIYTIDQHWELLNFDASTGKLSDGFVFDENPAPYGLEFSPDSKLLYISKYSLPFPATGGGIYQFNMGTYNQSAIESSKTLVGISTSNLTGLQLGPDNKIYCVNFFQPFLSVINNPDLPGTACNFSDQMIRFTNGTSPAVGLPAFLPGLLINKNADFNYSTGADCATINFSATSTLTGPVEWHWNFGDGTTDTGQNVTHIFHAVSVPGIDTVTLTVTSLSSCGFAVAVKKLSMDFRKPNAEFNFKTNCGSLEVSFFDSSNTGLPIQNRLWEFGDGNISLTENPNYIYGSPGQYTVRHSITSTNGCVSDTVMKILTLEANPEVSFTSASACTTQVQFTNTSSLSVGTISDYSWNFGDGSSSTATNPLHIYDKSGDYTVSLTAVTSAGCSDTLTRIFHFGPVKAFAGNDTIVAAGEPVHLHASGGTYYEWSPPDFLNANNIQDPVAVLDRDQTYQVRVTGDDGCTGIDDIKIRVLNGPAVYVPEAFVPNGKNRIFRPILAGIEELNFFSVYNRGGQLVFTTREPGKGWDGKIEGVVQPTGVYVWILKAKDYLGRFIVKKGTVVLIR